MLDEEELPGRAQRSPRNRRLLIALGVVVVIGLVVATVARIATRTTIRANPVTTVTPGPSRAPSPIATGVPQLRMPPASLPVLRRLTSAELAAAHAQCPRLAPTCITTGETPASVLAAIRGALPGAKRLVAVSVLAYSDTSGPRLIFRRLSARANGLVVAVRIDQTQSGDGDGALIVTGDEHLVRVETVGHGLTIEVQIRARDGRRLTLMPARRLAADPRLLAIG